jgi:Ca2+-binding EF-hand superfamily protein
MFTSQELMDLRSAFDAVSMGEDYVDREALKISFSNLGIFPSEEMLEELLNSIGKL